MKVRQCLTRGGAVSLAGILTILSGGCGRSQKQKSPDAPETATTQAIAEASAQDEENDCVVDGVTLPDDFEHMIYPIEAVMVDYYAQGYSYYKDGDDEMSFWCSMAILSSLLSENGCLDSAISDDYSFYTDEQINTFASALYYDFAMGKMSLAPLDDDDPYAVFDEDLGQYGLLNGNVGDLGISITSCAASTNPSGYVIGTELVDLESGDDLAEFSICIEAQNQADAGALFHYSISNLEALSAGSEESDISGEAGTESTHVQDVDEDGSDIDYEDGTDEEGSSEDNSGITDSSASDEEAISKETALALAQNYMGGDYNYNYKQMITIGDYEYYDFTITGEGSSMTDVLVSSDGSDVVSGVQNDDGSWSLDQ